MIERLKESVAAVVQADTIDKMVNELEQLLAV